MLSAISEFPKNPARGKGVPDTREVWLHSWRKESLWAMLGSRDTHVAWERPGRGDHCLTIPCSCRLRDCHDCECQGMGPPQ